MNRVCYCTAIGDLGHIAILTNAELGLFFSALISSTIAPGGSEALLGWLAAANGAKPLRLLLIATLGNTLGAMSTWGLGYWIGRYRAPGAVLDRVSPATLRRLRRWGAPLLLLSWLPLVGDGFCLAAGWLRLSLLASLLAIFVGKLLRYWAVIAAVGVF